MHIKMKPVDVKSSTHIDFGKNNKEDFKFKVDEHIRISKQNIKTVFIIFAKSSVLNWSEV